MKWEIFYKGTSNNWRVYSVCKGEQVGNKIAEVQSRYSDIKQILVKKKES